MATAESLLRNEVNFPWLVTSVKLTTIEPGETVTVEHNGPSGVVPDLVHAQVEVAPTHGVPPVSVYRILASDDTTNNTVALRVCTETGADLTGATVKVYFVFFNQASGGVGS